jgi:hypothetical protein
MVSPLFTNSETLFSKEALNQTSVDQASMLRADGYDSQHYAGVSNKAIPMTILPDIIVSEQENSQQSFSPLPDSTDNFIGKKIPSNLSKEQDNGREIVVDRVFDKTIINDPEVIDRAAKAFTRDLESMLLYMAVMNADSEKISAITDKQTAVALHSAIIRETQVMQQRAHQRLLTMGISDKNVNQIMEFFKGFNDGISSGLSSKDAESPVITRPASIL